MILIVDDSQMTRSVIRRVIGMTGLPVGEIREAANGRDALAIMASLALVTCDAAIADAEGAVHGY